MTSSATLTSLRARIRAQLEAAGGFTEPLVVTASSIQLSTGTPNLRDRVESRLQDSGQTRWSTDDTDDAIREALDQMSRQSPAHAIGTITAAAAGREHSLSTLTGLVRVERVWWDYDVASPGYPPNWRQFNVWPGSILYIADDTEPAKDDVIRVWYTLMHTIKGLDSATATTVPEEDIPYLVSGAGHFAALARAVELSETLNVDNKVVDRLMEWAKDQGKNFRYGVALKQPAWQRYAYEFQQGDLDEAIRLALHRYSEIDPARTIGTVTLDASNNGREIDISSLTGYQNVQRVWWQYTSTDKEYPPNWRDFDVWPGDILYIKDGDEPASGEVVRIWYTKRQTINGLDSATATTVPDDADTLIVTGASGYAAQERVQEQATRYVPRKLREWADARLREFDRGLKRLATRLGTRASGIAPGPDLDRWDSDGSGWH